MSETEILEAAWTACIKRVATMIDEYADGWVPNGPCAATASAIRKKVLAMPMPKPSEEGK